MAIITTQTFSDGTDKALSLENEEWGREMDIGSDWTRIRIGILFNISNVGTSNLASTSLRVGISNAANKHPGSGTGKLWYGALFGINGSSLGGGTFTYNAGGGDPYFSWTPNSRVTQVNTTLSGSGQSATTIGAIAGGSTNRRSCVFAEIKKVGDTMDVTGVSANSNQNVTLALFRTGMAYNANPFLAQNIVINGVNYSYCGTGNFSSRAANAATYGEPVAIQVGWNKSDPYFLNVFAIEAYRHE